MILRDLTKAGIGQFVLASGNVSILDLVMLKKAWDLKSVKKLATMGAEQSQAHTSNRQQRRASQSNPASTPAGTIDFMFDLLGIMPHGIQAQVLSGESKIWSALNADFFITPPADLSLNHGSHLPGIWNLVGILDAVPDNAAGPSGPADTEHSLVGNLTTTIQPLMRQMLGRPTSSYGLTPLLVFREVNG
ncbi:MAG: hypothetical protein WDM89_02065 [Rhizomicrobium sp.]